MDDRSELDQFAFRMESAVDRFVGDQSASANFVLVSPATDASVGFYPQAALEKGKVFLEDDGDPYRDRFPKSVTAPIQLKLRRAAKWTDVLSADLWSEGLLVSDELLPVFTGFPLGNYRRYASVVKKGKEQRAYTYLFFANHIGLEDADFTKSEFYVADMIGSPKSLIGVSSATEYMQTREKLFGGEVEGFGRFSRLDCKRLHFRKKHVPTAAVFGMGTLGVRMYLRLELCHALRERGVSGLEFKRNNQLFDC